MKKSIEESTLTLIHEDHEEEEDEDNKEEKEKNLYPQVQ